MPGFGRTPNVSLSWVTGTKSSSGDNEVIAAPASGLCTVITSLVIQNESTTATTMIVKAGSTALFRVLGQNQGDGLALNFDEAHELRLPAATALNLNLSGANSCGYSVRYYTDAA